MSGQVQDHNCQSKKTFGFSPEVRGRETPASIAVCQDSGLAQLSISAENVATLIMECFGAHSIPGLTLSDQ